jgi:uncharacterized protein
MNDLLERRSAVVEGIRDARVEGYAIVFDSRSRDLGGFVEVVRARAVDRALASDARIVALYNHDTASVLASTPQTMRLTKDQRGLKFSMSLPDTTVGRDVFELVTRGDVAGASFGFKTIRDAWSKDGDTLIRELIDIEIAEVTLTSFPAYTSTNVELAKRSLAAHQSRGRSIAWLRLKLSA